MRVSSSPRPISAALSNALLPSKGGGFDLPPLWALLVIQLDPHEEFTPCTIAKLFNVTPKAVRDNCAELWGDEREGHWRMEFEDVAVLIYRMGNRARKVSPQDVLENLCGSGLTGADVMEHPRVVAAWAIILLDRETRKRARQRASTQASQASTCV